MQQLVSLLEQYGLAFVFVHVLVEQAGVPLPAYPTLIVAGALSAHADYGVAQLLLAAVAASLIADFTWYFAGSHLGRPVLRTLCRISLSPDSCVRQTESIYLRWGAPSLLVAKFIPGFAAVATALAGSIGTRLWASAALVAKRLIQQGYTCVRPLYGGIDAWIAAGYAIEH